MNDLLLFIIVITIITILIVGRWLLLKSKSGKKIYYTLISILLLGISYISISNSDNDTNDNLTFKELNLEMVKCPAGSFKMGSPDNEIGRSMYEKLHQVTITKPFYIGKYEVTQSQYELVIGKNPSCFKGNNKPIEYIRLEDAKEFCYRLNAKYLHSLPKGYRFDLPSEAQWEYACRAGTNEVFFVFGGFGVQEGKVYNGINTVAYKKYDFKSSEDYYRANAWFKDNSNETTHEVGQKKPNAWGIFDMHGNVAEMCRDYYFEYAGDACDPVEDNHSYFEIAVKRNYNLSEKKMDINNMTTVVNVIRGGSFEDDCLRCRPADRNINYMRIPNCRLGFRVALVPIE